MGPDEDGGTDSFTRSTAAERAARATRLADDERVARILAWQRRAWVALGFGVSLVAGLALMGAAIATTDQRWGQVLFWGGLFVGVGGIYATLLVTYHRATRDGDH